MGRCGRAWSSASEFEKNGVMKMGLWSDHERLGNTVGLAYGQPHVHTKPKGSSLAGTLHLLNLVYPIMFIFITLFERIEV